MSRDRDKKSELSKSVVLCTLIMAHAAALQVFAVMVIKNPLSKKTAYQSWYKSSFSESFWLEQAQRLHWIVSPKIANRSRFSPTAEIRWFEDGILNVCYNCVDRHLSHNAEKAAIIFEPDECGHAERISYAMLHQKVCEVASALKRLGVQKGDIVTLYLPMDPSIIYSMLACARIGAIHSVVFSGYAPHALAERLAQSQSTVIITKTTSQRGGRTITLKSNVDAAIKENANLGRNNVSVVLLMDDVNTAEPQQSSFLSFFATDTPKSALEEVENASSEAPVTISLNTLEPSGECPCEPMRATDPLFILYTSGSTGRPKGVVHSSGGYLTYVAMTHELIFDIKQDDVYFCTADIGWITGHSYGVYGPLANGSTFVLFQGTPTYPDVSRIWDIIDRHKVSIFYTAPTALRALKETDPKFLQQASLKTLRVLGTVGEPIDERTWQWFFREVGHKTCPIMNTWWQTETGGVLICPLVENQKPSCTGQPFAGVALLQKTPALDKKEGASLLCITESWPGQLIGIFNDSKYFQQAYFLDGVYVSGDGARTDEDGDFWILGRTDDVLNVSGHRLNSAELEGAVSSHPAVVEACVVGCPHEIKGEGIFVFVVLRSENDAATARQDLTTQMRNIIGPIATPDKVLPVTDLPKTRSGKIVRRLLRKLASKDDLSEEDLSMLANPQSVATIAKLLATATSHA
jgi:acetyl-CoA synthetase